MLVIVEQPNIRLRRLDKGMSIRQADVCNDPRLGQIGQYDAAVLGTADRQRQFMFVELALALRVVDEVDAAQIASSQRTSNGGRVAPGLTLITLRTSR